MISNEDHLYRDVALEALRALPNYRELSYLELGCGDGLILDRLVSDKVKAARGTTYRERTTDYIRTRDYPEHLTVDGGVDLNKPLPYKDGEFDVVYTTEVIEHVEGHRNFILEAARVLKPGGWLVLTTPNVHRILSRINFAFSGIHLTKQTLIPWTHPAQQMEEFHHRVVDFPLLHWLLWKGGLKIQDVRSTQVHGASKFAMVLKPLFSRSVKKNVMRAASATGEDRQAREDLIKWMLSPALLSSEQMCVIAQKKN